MNEVDELARELIEASHIWLTQGLHLKLERVIAFARRAVAAEQRAVAAERRLRDMDLMLGQERLMIADRNEF